jgi:hypothetical protein
MNDNKDRSAADKPEHPGYEELLRYAGGQLKDAADSEIVRRHLLNCPSCLDEFLFISEDLLPDLARPITPGELVKARLMALIQAFEKTIHEERVPVPLFRLTMTQQPQAVTANATAPKHRTLQALVDLHRDPKLEYLTILAEDISGAVEILKSGKFWINRPIASLRGQQRIVLSEDTTRLHAVYSTAMVPVGDSANAAEFLESLTANNIAHSISSASVSAQSR